MLVILFNKYIYFIFIFIFHVSKYAVLIEFSEYIIYNIVSSSSIDNTNLRCNNYNNFSDDDR